MRMARYKGLSWMGRRAGTETNVLKQDISDIHEEIRIHPLMIEVNLHGKVSIEFHVNLGITRELEKKQVFTRSRPETR